MNPLDKEAWEAWSPDQLQRRLRGTKAPWYVVGGWAIDLHLGAQQRDHEDLEFAVLPQDAGSIARQLTGLTFFAVNDGDLSLWSPDMRISATIWQFWGAEEAARKWRVDMMIERGSQADWIYKRDSSIRQSRATAIRLSPTGIPYLAPANVLLFKAKYCRAKDMVDFEAVLPAMTAPDRAQLAAWLETCHPGHPWLDRLI